MERARQPEQVTGTAWDTRGPQGPPSPTSRPVSGAETWATSAINPPTKGHPSPVRWPLAGYGSTAGMSMNSAPSTLLTAGTAPSACWLVFHCFICSMDGPLFCYHLSGQRKRYVVIPRGYSVSGPSGAFTCPGRRTTAGRDPSAPRTPSRPRPCRVGSVPGSSHGDGAVLVWCSGRGSLRACHRLPRPRPSTGLPSGGTAPSHVPMLGGR